MTQVVEGEIRIQGMAHGALNTMVVPYANRDDWEFKQFMSDEQLREYAERNNYVIVGEMK